MAEYKVIVDFTDLEDGGHVYRADDPYPRKGAKVSEERVAELSSTENKRNEVLIVRALEKLEDKALEMGESTRNSATEAGDGLLHLATGDDLNEYPKHNGGGWYELSNGERVQGKAAAAKAEAELQK